LDFDGLIRQIQWADKAWRTLSDPDRAVFIKHHDGAALSDDEKAVVERLRETAPADMWECWGRSIDADRQLERWHREQDAAGRQRWPQLYQH
jgi:hypothetical protein